MFFDWVLHFFVCMLIFSIFCFMEKFVLFNMGLIQTAAGILHSRAELLILLGKNWKLLNRTLQCIRVLLVFYFINDVVGFLWIPIFLIFFSRWDVSFKFISAALNLFYGLAEFWDPKLKYNSKIWVKLNCHWY